MRKNEEVTSISSMVLREVEGVARFCSHRMQRVVLQSG